MGQLCMPTATPSKAMGLMKKDEYCKLKGNFCLYCAPLIQPLKGEQNRADPSGSWIAGGCFEMSDLKVVFRISKKGFAVFYNQRHSHPLSQLIPV